MGSLDRCGFGAYLEDMLLLPIPYSSLSVSILLASTCLLNHLGCLTSFFRGIHLGAGALLDRKLLRCVESFHAVALSAHVSVGAMVGARCVGLVATTGGRSREGIKGHPWGSIDAVRRHSGRGGGRMVVWLVLAAVWRAGVGVLLVVMRGLGGIRVVQLDRGKGRHVGPSHVLSRDCSHVGQRIKADDDEIEDGDGCDMDARWRALLRKRPRVLESVRAWHYLAWEKMVAVMVKSQKRARVGRKVVRWRWYIACRSLGATRIQQY